MLSSLGEIILIGQNLPSHGLREKMFTSGFIGKFSPLVFRMIGHLMYELWFCNRVRFCLWLLMESGKFYSAIFVNEKLFLFYFIAVLKIANHSVKFLFCFGVLQLKLEGGEASNQLR